MSKILVTGGAGFIGSNLVDALIDKGHEVAIVDDLSTGSKENINKKAEFFKVDITNKKDLSKVFEKAKPEAVFHLAAQTSVRHSVEDPKGDEKINVGGTVNLLELCKKYKVKRIIFSSTGGAIYGNDAPRPTVEGARERPASPYGKSKLKAEQKIARFVKKGYVRATILRYANVYGERQNPHGEAGVVAIFAAKMLEGKPVCINGTGEQTRDFVYVSDVVGTNLNAFEMDVDGIFNIGTGVEISINEIANLMKKLSLSDSKITHGIAKPGEQMYSSLSFKKARREFNWQPSYSLSQGLRKTLDWFKNK